MSNARENKARERRIIELFKSALAYFPEGEIFAGEEQERPDAVVATPRGKIGIEITSLYDNELKRKESECEKAVAAARLLYEKQGLPALHVSVHIGGENSFNRASRERFASAIVGLVAANVPPPGKYVALENDFNNPKQFPYEIDCIHIYRYSWPDKNNWTAPSAGFYREHFIEELQRVISDKDAKLGGYMPDCKEQWLLVVAENSSPSTFFDPSKETVSHIYESAFDKVFVMELFKVKVFELTLVKKA
jgi:hypothetical protein